MADRLTTCVQQIIDFSKMVPGFMQLQQDDQITLLKSGSYSIALLYAAQCFSPDSNSFYMANHKSLNIQHILSELQMLASASPSKKPSSSSLSLDEQEVSFVQQNVEFIRQLREFQLSQSELALLSAIILFNHENPALNDHKAVYCAQQRFIEILRQDIENNRNQQNPSSLEKQQIIQQLLNLVSVNLRHLSNLHFELIKSFKIKNPQIEFPPLHRELFNVDYFVYCHQQQQLQQQQQQQQMMVQQQHYQQPQQQMGHYHGIQQQPQPGQMNGRYNGPGVLVQIKQESTSSPSPPNTANNVLLSSANSTVPPSPPINSTGRLFETIN